jgi:heme/copper-type cytochrome/quinol oxidase subunit 2
LCSSQAAILFKASFSSAICCWLYYLRYSWTREHSQQWESLELEWAIVPYLIVGVVDVFSTLSTMICRILYSLAILSAPLS